MVVTSPCESSNINEKHIKRNKAKIGQKLLHTFNVSEHHYKKLEKFNGKRRL